MAQGASEPLTTGPAGETGRLRLLGEILALAGIYLVAARLGLLMAHPGTNATAVWLPTGIAMAAVLRWGSKIWPGIFLGSLGVNAWLLLGLGLSAQASFWAALAAAAGNSGEAVLAGFLIERFTGTRNPFGRSKDVVQFIFLGALLSTALSALVGVSSLCAANGRWNLFGASVLTWWLGDATGALLVTPLVMTFGQRAHGVGAFPKRLEFLFFATVTSVLWYVSFFNAPSLVVVFIPWIALVGVRLGLFFSSAIVLLLAGLATWGTLHGAGPFAARTLEQSLLLQQAFIGSIAVATLVLGSTVWEIGDERRRLRDAYRFEREVFDRSSLGMALCTMEGRLVEANPSYAALLGRTVDETLSLSYWDATPKEYGEQEDAQLASLRQTGRYGPYEKEYLRKDGTRVPVRLSGLLVERHGKTYIWSTAEDITDRKRAEEAQRESDRKYRELVENANSIILRWTPDGRINFLNEFGQRFFGYSEEEIRDRHLVGTIVPPSERSGRDLKPLMDDISRDPAAFEQNINENARRNGERVWIAWTNKAVLDERGQVKEILSIGSDITARKKAEEELMKYREHLEDLVQVRTAELAEAKERAESADRLKSAFLATMSHELRTPLNSIIGFTGILLQGLGGPLNGEQKKQLGMVGDSASHLLNLINDVLDISKIEAGQLQVRREPFDLREAIEKAVRTAQPLADKKGITLGLNVGPGVGTITSDRRRVEQILLNLLSNAIKFTDEGGVLVACSAGESEVAVKVSDTGIGVKSEDMDRLFKPFRQIDSGITRRYEGTGLGLSICKKLVALLGGAIWVESEWGKGSTFHFTLPSIGGAA